MSESAPARAEPSTFANSSGERIAMSHRKTIDGLQRHRREQSEQKQRNVLQAIQSLTYEEREISIAAVSRRAQVSREFIHSHAHLHSAVTQAAKQVKEARQNGQSTSPSSDIALGLRADRTTLLSRLEKQRVQISDQQNRLQKFDRDRQRWLGVQLERDDTVDPEAHTKLRVENERLSAENTTLSRQVADLRRTLGIVEEKLAASKQAHAEDVLGRPTDIRSVARFERGPGGSGPTR
ncbi:DUF6262 family protein [Arthrobacter sp. SO3]|uniref:DUF6262 family protein n=1 Tax=Arthrobacter sp. SO3 TaxID=1897057 RepID=UPI00299F2008|nr:DUF6262 family protein [Arthrobacter sp. SO3]